MKKFFSITLLLTAMFLTLSACSSDDDEEIEIADTIYMFTYTGENPPDGVYLNVTLFEYNELGEKIAQNHFNRCRKGYYHGYIANKNSLKVKVYLETTNGSKSDANWVQQVFYLEKGNRIEITVTGESRIGKTEP